MAASAPNLILPRGLRSADQVNLVSHEQDDGKWSDEPEWSDEFAAGLWLVLYNHDIDFDPTLTREQAAKTRDLGVLSAHFSPWEVHVNWSTGWAQKVPPHHMAILWRGIEQAIIGPYLVARTCWKCGLGCPLGSDGSWDDRRYFNYATAEQQARNLPYRWPKVQPAQRCPGQKEWYPLLRTYRRIPCGEYDWFGTQAYPEAYLVDAAAAGHLVTNGELDYSKTTITHNPDNPDKPMTRIRANV